MSEKLSSLMDSELGAAEQGVLIDKLVVDAEMAAKWSRYNLVSYLITCGDESRITGSVVGDVSARIAELVEAEPTVIAPATAALNAPISSAEANVTNQTGFVKNNVSQLTPMRAGVVGFALAASIAAVSVAGLNSGLFQSEGAIAPAFVIQPDSSTSSVSPVLASTSGSTRWDTDVAAHENDLNSLLVEHGEFMPPPGLNGLMAYAKFVSYDAQ